MSEQVSLCELEYAQRKRGTKRDALLKKADVLFPWVEQVAPYYPKGRSGRQPRAIETMLRMALLQRWFGLSDAAAEEAILDSYAMKRFMHIDFMQSQPPDATTLRRFNALLKKRGLDTVIEQDMRRILKEKKLTLRRGSLADPMLIKKRTGEKPHRPKKAKSQIKSRASATEPRS